MKKKKKRKGANMNNATTPRDNRSKDTKYLSQFRLVNQFLHHNTASRYMTAVSTGIPIQNVCRYIDTLRKSDSVAIIRIDKCSISGEMVEFLSTNPAIFPKDNQLRLWDETE